MAFGWQKQDVNYSLFFGRLGMFPSCVLCSITRNSRGPARAGKPVFKEFILEALVLQSARGPHMSFSKGGYAKGSAALNVYDWSFPPFSAVVIVVCFYHRVLWHAARNTPQSQFFTEALQRTLEATPLRAETTQISCENHRTTK